MIISDLHGNLLYVLSVWIEATALSVLQRIVFLFVWAFT